MSKETVKVVVRSRPFSKKELDEGHSCIVEISRSQASVLINDPKQQGTTKSFTFDSVFDESAKQKEIYDSIA